jgi:hypothetical protein
MPTRVDDAGAYRKNQRQMARADAYFPPADGGHSLMNIGHITARELEIRPLDAYFLPANGGGRFLMSIGRIGARGEPVRPPAA